ncbi:MAG: hypothetical protein R6W90_04090 [Ignavibacteriaceae bacterium]
MKKITFILLAAYTVLFPQENRVNLRLPENIRLFADHLFCEKDYLRSAFEYENYLSSGNNDTISFKLGLAYQNLEEYDKSAGIFKSLFPRLNSRSEYFNSYFKKEDYENFRLLYSSSSTDLKEITSVKKLFLYSFLFSGNNIPSENEYQEVFNSDERIMSLFYERINLPNKNQLTAALLSALVPGAGKIYTEQYGDGITAFIVTGLLSYLSYANFDAEHNFRGWLFGGLAALFYAGNIYGSAASTHIYNAGVKINFEKELKLFLNNQNYFMPEYNFCR